jgi:hypothetical protein
MELESTLISTSKALLTKGGNFLSENSSNPTKKLSTWVANNSEEIKSFNSKVNSSTETSLSTFTQTSGGNMNNILDYMETKIDQYNSIISEIFEDATKSAAENLGQQRAQFLADKGKFKKKIRERFGFYRKTLEKLGHKVASLRNEKDMLKYVVEDGGWKGKVNRERESGLVELREMLGKIFEGFKREAVVGDAGVVVHVK